MADKNNKIPCTIYIMTLNAGPGFKRCLESVQDYADILVTDGNSTDGTQEMARNYGARVIKQVDSNEPNVPIKDFAAVQNRCIKEAKYDWIFQLDMDESMSPEINEEIRTISSKTPEYWAYYVPRNTVYEDRIIKYSTGYKNYVDSGYEMKFFNRTSGCVVVRSPHHRLDFDEKKYPVGHLKEKYNAYFTIPEYNEGKNYPKRFMDMEIKEIRKQTWPDFLTRTIIIRFLKTVKKLFKFLWLYIRYGFKDTFPPAVEFGKIQYSWGIMTGAIKERLNSKYKEKLS